MTKALGVTWPPGHAKTKCVVALDYAEGWGALRASDGLALGRTPNVGDAAKPKGQLWAHRGATGGCVETGDLPTIPGSTLCRLSVTRRRTIPGSCVIPVLHYVFRGSFRLSAHLTEPPYLLLT